MYAVDQPPEVGMRTKFRVDTSVVGNGIVASQASFALFKAHGMDRHEPKNVYAHGLQSRQVSRKSIKSTFGTVLPYIDFVDIGLLGPGRGSSRRLAPASITCRKRVEVACLAIVAACKHA